MIEPVQFQRSLPGKSKGHIIKFSDGREYVVKFARHGFEKVLPNEWIAYCLARFMNLQIPYSRIISLSEDSFRRVPDTSDVRYEARHFASLYIPNCMNLHEVSNVMSVVNHESLAGIILLDYWLCNRDRNRNNVLLQEEGAGSYRLWMIDQGDIFESCNWTLERLESLSIGLYKSSAHRQMARFIQNEEAFTKYMDVIRTIPKLLIEEIIAMIPEEWAISADEREAVVQKLIFRRDKQLDPLRHRFIKRVYRPLHMQGICRDKGK